ncbi:hypothetical protein BRADI_2g58016v3 [Brachypodium distachyon]|uniref:Uncharacterized protein n=1 Tax=Brachypodium distachyon TaxID=15368 RepID=A0A2K2DGJ3_BRADI|nr:hypothetical protein BRADI_2g58016v3 [Brachypodium distachyon]
MCIEFPHGVVISSASQDSQTKDQRDMLSKYIPTRRTFAMNVAKAKSMPCDVMSRPHC